MFYVKIFIQQNKKIVYKLLQVTTPLKPVLMYW
jgi:hypothetical protein